jgi:putative membrane protein
MIVRKNLNLRLILQTQWPVLVLTALWACVPTVLYYGEVNPKVSLDLPVSLLGTTLAFLIAFRNNNAYERWWEARRIWGEVVNDSRSFGAQVLALLDVRFGTGTDTTVLKGIQQELIYRQIGFAYALKDHLRQLPVGEATSRFFSVPDWEAISHQRNRPNAILYQQALQLSRYTAAGYLEDFRHMQLDTKLGRFFESLGKCERIKNTVFPPQYDYFTRLTLLKKRRISRFRLPG